MRNQGLNAEKELGIVNTGAAFRTSGKEVKEKETQEHTMIAFVLRKRCL